MKFLNKKNIGLTLKTGLLAATFSVALSQAASGDLRPLAANYFGKLNLNGNGCPSGSVHMAWSETKGQLVLIFDDFSARAGGTKSLDRIVCMMALPLSLPSGIRVQTAGMRLEGFASLPRGAQSRLNMESFFAGSKGSLISKVVRGPFQNDLQLSTNVGAASAWSRCGTDVILRANISVMLQNRHAEEEAFVALTEGSASESAYVIDLKFASCR